MLAMTAVVLAASVGALSVRAESVRTNVVETVSVRSASADAERVPAVIAPVYRDFVRKCEQKVATRGDLIALKRFIAASALDGAAKQTWTQRARKAYQDTKKVKVGGQGQERTGR